MFFLIALCAKVLEKVASLTSYSQEKVVYTNGLEQIYFSVPNSHNNQRSSMGIKLLKRHPYVR